MMPLLWPNTAEGRAEASQLIEVSGAFDADWYRHAADRTGSPSELIEHYLETGWSIGLEPNRVFEGAWLYPYFRSAGFSDPPLLTYLALRAANWPVFETRARCESVAAIVRASKSFDAEHYQRQAPDLGSLDPALHYVLVGEQLGLAPSLNFDPKYYVDRHPDIGHYALAPLYHYLTKGWRKQRRPISLADELNFDRSRLDPSRKTILLVTHQASRTGAPILAYNIAKRLCHKFNIVTVVLQPGELMSDYQTCSSAVIGPIMQRGDIHPVEADYLVKRILANYPICYALVNSIESRAILQPLTLALVPVVALVHEFSSHLDFIKRGEMGRVLDWATQIVFSSRASAESARVDYPHLEQRPVHVLAQGECELPPRHGAAAQQDRADLSRAIRPPSAEHQIVVLGCGTIAPRKGVDLFFECALRVSQIKTERPVRFVWIGARQPQAVDERYYARLQAMLRRSGLSDRAVILDEVADLDPAYAAADILFVSARLDPLPNIAIDAALRGLPIVCFQDAGGVPEFLSQDVIAATGVVPNLDVAAAAAAIAKLAGDADLRRRVGDATLQIGRRTFDMERYTEQLNTLGEAAVAIMRQRKEDFETIRNDPLFDMWHFLDYESPIATRDDAIRYFLARAGALCTTTQPTANFYFRRPCPGFHPQIYAHENAQNYDATVINPLAQFIRSGKPEGPWRHDVIGPDQHAPPVERKQIRVAIHGHFFYPELISDFLRRLESNRSRCDLLLTTNSRAKARVLQKATANFARGEVTIQITPNTGRDIGAMLTAYPRKLGEYDIVGHLHAKRTIHHRDPTLGERWREFLWQNLLGDEYPMMDTILDRFATDAKTGLIFADEPHLSDWDFNRAMSEQLAQKMGLKIALPQYFDFPVGTMFWARYAAIEPLIKLGLGWSDYPPEPAPIDGTILHAIERLLPSIARHAGYRYLTTHVPGVTW
jgi:glycosyltransferase involved in cell wall biosynthesis